MKYHYAIVLFSPQKDPGSTNLERVDYCPLVSLSQSTRAVIVVRFPEGKTLQEYLEKSGFSAPHVGVPLTREELLQSSMKLHEWLSPNVTKKGDA